MNLEFGVGIVVGCLSGLIGFCFVKYIFVVDKGDYYDINDGFQQIDQYQCGGIEICFIFVVFLGMNFSF